MRLRLRTSIVMVVTVVVVGGLRELHAWSSSTSSYAISPRQQQQQQLHCTTSSSSSSSSSTVNNWIAIAQHLQCKDLYNATAWANGCRYEEDAAAPVAAEDTFPKTNPTKAIPRPNRARTRQRQRRLVTTRPVDRVGEILTLHPIHCLNVLADEEVEINQLDQVDSSSSSGIREKDDEMKGFLLPPRIHVELYRHSGLQANTRLEIWCNTSIQTPGWLGHLAASSSSSPRHNNTNSSTVNCRIVSLWGAAPLCALASVRPLAMGEELVVAAASSSDETFTNATYSTDDGDELEMQVLQRYAAEIAELRSFTTMAHPPPPFEDVENELDDNHKTPPVYHPIQRNYPGLTVLHPAQPEILQIEHFLSPDECRRLIEKARPHLQASLVTTTTPRDPESNTTTGSNAAVTVYADASRTSTNANVAQREIPTLIQRMVDLMQCPNRHHLETVQILHYAPGQAFAPHTDGWDGRPVTACGFEQSQRLVTLFCYLNECHEGGGETHFAVPNVTVTPRVGRAVLHFPSAVSSSSGRIPDNNEDATTVHESWPVQNGSEKWLLVTWMWQHVRSDPRYHEVLVPTLSDDVI